MVFLNSLSLFSNTFWFWFRIHNFLIYFGIKCKWIHRLWYYTFNSICINLKLPSIFSWFENIRKGKERSFIINISESILIYIVSNPICLEKMSFANFSFQIESHNYIHFHEILIVTVPLLKKLRLLWFPNQNNFVINIFKGRF